tara:strand:- start:311 stop:721 length:411 start_codon:yes stop_codon:yes gene_type:complete
VSWYADKPEKHMMTCTAKDFVPYPGPKYKTLTDTQLDTFPGVMDLLHGLCAITHPDGPLSREFYRDSSTTVIRLCTTIADLEETIAVQLALVHRQAEDDGLWFVAQTAPEGYLQQELRRLHSAIEANAASLVDDKP